MNTDFIHGFTDDLAGFYRDRFLSGSIFEASYFDAIDRFDIKYARTMWIYDNVRRGSSLLDLGCGEGVLALLKRKEVYLAGVDLSPDLVAQALRNGYDAAHVGLLTDLPFPDASFDYVVSLDVFGHVGFDEKDAVLQEIKRVLRPDGVTMHGVESLDAKLHSDYHTMSPEKLAHFIGIDGHIGLEVDEDIARRFAKFFSFVQTEPRYTLCLSVDEFIKQFDHYGAPFDKDFIDYLRGLSFDERRAFDLAMGYIFGRISDLHVQLPSSGLYLLVKASNVALEPFYNAHRDRSDLVTRAATKTPINLDTNSRAFFGNGWYPANNLPPIARWMRAHSWLRFDAGPFTRIRLQLTTHIPDLRSSPMELNFELNGETVCNVCLFEYGWLELVIEVPKTTRDTTSFKLDIRASRTWQPSAGNAASNDDRHLSIAVCNLEIS